MRKKLIAAVTSIVVIVGSLIGFSSPVSAAPGDVVQVDFELYDVSTDPLASDSWVNVSCVHYHPSEFGETTTEFSHTMTPGVTTAYVTMNGWESPIGWTDCQVVSHSENLDVRVGPIVHMFGAGSPINVQVGVKPDAKPTPTPAPKPVSKPRERAVQITHVRTNKSRTVRVSGRATPSARVEVHFATQASKYRLWKRFVRVNKQGRFVANFGRKSIVNRSVYVGVLHNKFPNRNNQVVKFRVTGKNAKKSFRGIIWNSNQTGTLVTNKSRFAIGGWLPSRNWKRFRVANRFNVWTVAPVKAQVGIAAWR